MMRTAAIVVAAGRGERAGGARPKQYRNLLGEPVLRRALRALALHPAIDAVQAVIDPAESEAFQSAAGDLPKCLAPAAGGSTRQRSVRAGLEALAALKPVDRPRPRCGPSPRLRRSRRPRARRGRGNRRRGSGHRVERYRQTRRRNRKDRLNARPQRAARGANPAGFFLHSLHRGPSPREQGGTR